MRGAGTLRRRESTSGLSSRSRSSLRSPVSRWSTSARSVTRAAGISPVTSSGFGRWRSKRVSTSRSSGGSSRTRRQGATTISTSRRTDATPMTTSTVGRELDRETCPASPALSPLREAGAIIGGHSGRNLWPVGAWRCCSRSVDRLRPGASPACGGGAPARCMVRSGRIAEGPARSGRRQAGSCGVRISDGRRRPFRRDGSHDRARSRRRRHLVAIAGPAPHAALRSRGVSRLRLGVRQRSTCRAFR